MAGEVMHIITDEEYRAYIELTRVVRDIVMSPSIDPKGYSLLDEALTRVLEAHNKRLNSLKRAHGT